MSDDNETVKQMAEDLRNLAPTADRHAALLQVRYGQDYTEERFRRAVEIVEAERTEVTDFFTTASATELGLLAAVLEAAARKAKGAGKDSA